MALFFLFFFAFFLGAGALRSKEKAGVGRGCTPHLRSQDNLFASEPFP